MTILDIPADNTHGVGQFPAQIADETLAFHDFSFDDRKVTASQVAEKFGAFPLEDFVVLHWLANHQLETLRPNEHVDLKDGAKLFVIKGDGTDRFFVDGMALEWPKKRLTGEIIKFLAGKDEDLELVLARENQPDKVIDDFDEVHIGGDGVEKFYTRAAQAKITILVNQDEHRVPKGKVSYDQVVALYLSDGGAASTEYLIKYSRGPAENVSGTLAPGNKVVVKDGMRFRVSGTGES